MKRLEIRMYADIDENEIDFKDIEQTLLYDFSQISKVDVKRVDLINEIEVA